MKYCYKHLSHYGSIRFKFLIDHFESHTVMQTVQKLISFKETMMSVTVSSCKAKDLNTFMVDGFESVKTGNCIVMP